MREIRIPSLLILLFITVSSAQSNDSMKSTIPSIDIQPKGIDYTKKYSHTENDTPFVAVEKMPEPIGGIKGIQGKLKYPRKAIKNKVEGTVYILAFVDEFGDVTKAMVLKGIGSGCDEVALEAVKETKFIPGMQEGKNVKVQISIPIIFRLLPPP
ncbi:MAG: energy transducer TonB [Ignavibacteriaceae bacterium]|nr:energy transducer TonB [Ignavibacteriaceae bacterium]